MVDSINIDRDLVQHFMETEYMPFLGNLLNVLEKRELMAQLDNTQSLQGTLVQLVENIYMTKSVIIFTDGKEITVMYNSANNFVMSSNGVNSDLLEATYVNIDHTISLLTSENDSNVKH
jgi:hypothetical protein